MGMQILEHSYLCILLHELESRIAACRQIMQRYKAKVAAGYYEQLRPRTMRERLDELTLAVHRLAQGQCTPISPAMRADLERERAFGGISAEEELQQHQENLERLDNDVSGPTESGMMSGLTLIVVSLQCSSPVNVAKHEVPEGPPALCLHFLLR